MPRRSLRERRAPASAKSVFAPEDHFGAKEGDASDQEDASESRSSLSTEHQTEEESEEEWRPEESSQLKKRRKVEATVSPSPSSHGTVSDGYEQGHKRSQPPKKRKRSSSKAGRGSESTGAPLDTERSAYQASSSDDPSKRRSGDDYDLDVDDEEERVRLAAEAQAAWEKVRRRKDAGESTTTHPSSAMSKIPTGSTAKDKRGTATSLNSWLGLPPIPWPTSPESARVNDRDSLFIGFVYPVTSSTPSTLAQHLNHLSTTVHPTLPSNIFPDMLSHLDPKRRGSSHDIQAWRVLELKRGRDGLGGPNDFALEEGQDDDGERWGGEKILRVMKEMGAVDVFVVVSRWYGGTNLGPVRFDHIAQCAKEAIRAYMSEEVLIPLRKELTALDAEIATLRLQVTEASSSLTPISTSSQRQRVESNSYADLLDAEKGHRLLIARKKTIGLLQKRVDAATAGTQVEVVERAAAERMSSQAGSRLTKSPFDDDVSAGKGAPSIPADPNMSQLNAVDGEDGLQGWDDLA